VQSNVDYRSLSSSEVKSNYVILWTLHSPPAAFKVAGLNDNFHSAKTMAKWNQEMKGIESLLLIFSTHAVRLLKLPSRLTAILDGGKNLSCEYIFL
jgi:hypothetical protein